MKNSLVLFAIVVLVSSVAGANVNPSLNAVSGKVPASETRQNGTLGSLTITAQQVGALEVQLDASVTTRGGDGIPFYGVTTGGSPITLNDQIWLYGQIYDSPWNGGCTFWTTSPGTDWCGVGDEYFMNSPTALGSFALSFTTTVPRAMNYQTFVMAAAGLTWPTTGYAWGRVSASTASSVVETIYIDATVPATATPDPNAGGNPIPSLNRLGVLAMIVMLLGVAILVIVRRK